MRKLLNALVLTAGLFPVVVHAQTKYPDWASNGPALIGAKNGIAPLDSNKNITNSVIGDTSSSLVTALSHNASIVGPTTPQLMADDGYIHSLGSATVNSSGVISSNDLKTIISTATRPMNLHISSGESLLANQSSVISLPSSQYNRVMVTADGELLGSWDEDHTGADWLGGNLSKQIGEGVLVEDFEPRWGIMRDREYNDSSIYDYSTYRAPAGISADYYTKNVQWTSPSQCASSSTPGYNGYWCDIGSWKTSVHYDSINTSSNAGTNGRLMDFISTGQGHWKSDDVGDWVRMQLKGTNWGWSEIREMVEPTGIAIGGYTDTSGTAQFPGFQRYIYEWDMYGVGPDKATAYYNPVLSNRKAVWMAATDIGGMTWTASTSVPQFQILLVTDSTSGKTYMYENTVDGATTGTTEPKFAFNETTAISDGTASWIFLGVRKYQIGCFICTGGKDGSEEFGALIGSTSMFYDSPIDLSTVVYDTAINSVMRTEENSFFDLSANGTQAGQNNHLFGYGSYNGIGWSTLEYIVNKNVVLHVNDAGFIGVPVGGIKATGTTFDDAATSNTPFTEIYGASGDNAGVKIRAIGREEQFDIYNFSGHPVRIYPAIAGWVVNGADSYYTLQSGEWAHGYVAYGNNLNIHSSNHVGNFLADGDISLSKAVIPTNTTQTLSAIRAAGYTAAGTQIWCGTCRAPGEATGTGTGRYVYLNSKGVWKTLDGIDASE